MTTDLTITSTTWHAEHQLIITHISGMLTIPDIESWKTSLYDTLNQLEDNSTFKIFVNLHGFKAVDIATHKKFRSIIPLTLASYGWRVGYLDLFEEAANLPLANTRGIQCIAAAHAHHDETKILLYETAHSRPAEHFFTDPIAAEHWIRNYNPLKQQEVTPF